jgi:hypothetical protein
MADITLTVYFSGTGHEIDSETMLAGYLNNASIVDAQHLTMGFNGCGIDYGTRGVIFGTGLEEQCETVLNKVIALLKQGKRVKLNSYGHSRGAIACLLLAKMLGKFDRDLLEVNLALMDPVPGNLVSVSTIDFTHRTLARKAMDVSDCRNLNRVLAIYPHLPLPDFVFHAPLVPRYPTHCEVVEEIVPGCHAESQFVQWRNGELFDDNKGASITLSLVSVFLAKLGTKFKFLKSFPTAVEEQATRSRLRTLYSDALAKQQKSALSYSRACHAPSSVSIETKWPAKYLSHTHKKLMLEAQAIPLESKQNASQDCAYFFSSSKPSSRVVPALQPEPESTLEDKIALFAELLNEVYSSHMSHKSQNSSKGFLIKECADRIQIPSLLQNETVFKDFMRNAFALCLQRDRNAYSPFSMTRSGLAVVALLHSKKYRSLVTMILNSDDKKIRYRDLREFVLGRNDEAYFNAKKSKSMYQFFQPKDLEQGVTPRLLANNMNFYLARR